MKRPEKLVIYAPVEAEKDGIWVDWNGKPKMRYYVNIPYWLARAYRLDYRCIKIVVGNTGTMQQRHQEGKPAKEYFEANWAGKVTKMRGLNHSYITVSTEAVSRGGFASIEDYETYHTELKKLNDKYRRR